MVVVMVKIHCNDDDDDDNDDDDGGGCFTSSCDSIETPNPFYSIEVVL